MSGGDVITSQALADMQRIFLGLCSAAYNSHASFLKFKLSCTVFSLNEKPFNID